MKLPQNGDYFKKTNLLTLSDHYSMKASIDLPISEINIRHFYCSDTNLKAK